MKGQKRERDWAERYSVGKDRRYRNERQSGERKWRKGEKKV